VSGTSNTGLAKKWNWGAFLLGPLWALINKVWIGLIAWAPHLLVIFIMIISRIIILIINEPVYISLEDRPQSSTEYPLDYVISSLSFVTNMIGANQANLSMTLLVSFVWYLFVVCILGIKGNKWALKKRTINDLNHFVARQRKLSILGFLFGLPLVYLNHICLDFLIRLHTSGVF
jgi:hypothetical protein